MSIDQTAEAWRWLQEFPVRPHPDLGRDGVVCPFMGRALKRDRVKLFPFDATAGDRALAERALRLRPELQRQAEEAGPDRNYVVFFIVPYGLPDPELKAMTERVHTALKPQWIELGLMLGDFWPDHETAGLHSPVFRPFASPTPLLGMRHIVVPDLTFFIAPDVPPAQQLTYIGHFRRIFGDQLTGGWLDRANAAEAAARAALAGRPVEA